MIAIDKKTMNMTSKSMTLLMLSACLLLTATPALASFDRDTVETWEGTLRLFGNEPFTQVALVTDTGERWFLDMDEQELQQLWNDRRGRIRVTGVPVLQEYAGREEHVIKVIKYTWIADDK
jgi:hypothetical protein